MPSSHHSRNASRHAWIPSVSLPNVRDSALDLTDLPKKFTKCTKACYNTHL